MKILQLVTSRKSRGAEISAFLLSKELIKLGHEVCWVGLYPVGAEESLDLEGALTVDLLGNPKKTLDLALVLRLRSLISDFNSDIIQANGSDTWKYSVLALIGNSKPKLVYRNISIMSHWVGGRSIVRLVYRLLAKRMDYFCSVGEAANQDIKKLLQLSPEKCGVIRRGIPIDPVDNSKGRSCLNQISGINEDDFVLIQLGRLSPEKNIGFSIRLVDELKDQIPNVKLLIVGEGEELKSLKALVDQLKLGDRVFFLGHRKEDLNLIIAGSDLMLLTSLIEGVPGVILEAAIQKVPTVAVNVGGVKEIIQNNETGILIESHDLLDFKKAVLILFQNLELRLKMSQKAFLLTKEIFSIEANSKAFEQMYLRLISS